VTKIKDDILKQAENIHWVPEHIKDGRFGKWLEGARDWSISRQRFWGSVMPIWICDKCGEKKVFGSIQELEKISGAKIKDLHKHTVDQIEFKCDKCDGQMKRIDDVLDCWFESGSMPYAQMHYPFENKENFEKNFPAEFIAEGVDQTRCWFYYLNVLSVALENSHAFKNVIANGIVLAEDGKKMSKRLKNYPEPMDVFDQFGADAVRYYLATSPVVKADDLCFNSKDVEEVVKKVLLILWNVFSFYQMYAENTSVANLDINDINNILDRWILAKMELLKKEITQGYNNYDLNQATRPIQNFINDLSTWYLRRSRDRFKSDNQKDKNDALVTLKYVLINLCKLMAPVMPFISDFIYQELKGEQESVHLEKWATLCEDWIDNKIIDQMEIVREIASLGLEQRASVGMGVRQPLAKIIVKFPNLKELPTELEEILLDELNIKAIEYHTQPEKEVELDTQLTPELKREGVKRELVRQINNLRKNAGLTIKDTITLYYQSDNLEMKEIINDLLSDVVADKSVEEKVKSLQEKELKTDLGEVWVGIVK
jgi:isoleucyl-tRNA synthetase